MVVFFRNIDMSFQKIYKDVLRHIENNHYFVDSVAKDLYVHSFTTFILSADSDLESRMLVTDLVSEIFSFVLCHKFRDVVENHIRILEHLLAFEKNSQSMENESELVFLIFTDEFQNSGTLKSNTFYTFLLMLHYTRITGKRPNVLFVEYDTTICEASKLKSNFDHTKKKLVALIFDDISYSGLQLGHTISFLRSNFMTKFPNLFFKFCFSKVCADTVFNLRLDLSRKFQIICHSLYPSLFFVPRDTFDFKKFYSVLKKGTAEVVTILDEAASSWTYKNLHNLNHITSKHKIALASAFNYSLRDLEVGLTLDFFVNNELNNVAFGTDQPPIEINTKLIFLDYKIPSFASINHFIISGYIPRSLSFQKSNFENWAYNHVGSKGKSKIVDWISQSVIRVAPFVFSRSLDSKIPVEDIQLNFDSDGNISFRKHSIRFYSKPIYKDLILNYLDDQDKVTYTQSNILRVN